MRITPALLIFCVMGIAGTGCAGSRAVTTTQTVAPGLTVHLTTAPFNRADYQIVTTADGHDSTVGCDTWYGNDNAFPEIVVTSGWVVRDGVRMDLDTSCMGSYDPGPAHRADPIGTFQATPRSEPGTWTLVYTFGDGAGTSQAEWTVGRTSTARTRLEGGPALIERLSQAPSGTATP